jgi:hypothetical protein
MGRAGKGALIEVDWKLTGIQPVPSVFLKFREVTQLYDQPGGKEGRV